MQSIYIMISAVVLLCATLFYGYFVVWALIRQKEHAVYSKDQIHALLNKNLTGKTLLLSAGEANIAFYDGFCRKLDEQIDRGSMTDIHFMVGPRLSTWEDNQQKLKKLDTEENWYPNDGMSEEEIAKLHPILDLIRKHPSRVKISLKDDDSLHFAIADNHLYIEKPHEPLEEKCGMLIERPNPLLKRQYKKMFDRLTQEGAKCIRKENMHDVAFGYFQKRSSSCAGKDGAHG